MSEENHRYDAAVSMIEKLRGFAATLDDEERTALHALLIPGVANAFEETEVSGHALTTWSPGALPHWLTDAMDSQGLRVEGLDSGADTAHKTKEAEGRT
jgi:hypothetical protein